MIASRNSINIEKITYPFPSCHTLCSGSFLSQKRCRYEKIDVHSSFSPCPPTKKKPSATKFKCKLFRGLRFAVIVRLPVFNSAQVPVLPKGSPSTHLPATSIYFSQATANLPASQATANLPASQATANLPASQATANLPASQATTKFPASSIS